MDTQKQIDNFCRNIRSLRQANHLTQKQMAKLLEISLYSLRRIESGTVPPKLDVDILFKIHETFGILPSRLFAPDLDFPQR